MANSKIHTWRAMQYCLGQCPSACGSWTPMGHKASFGGGGGVTGNLSKPMQERATIQSSNALSTGLLKTVLDIFLHSLFLRLAPRPAQPAISQRCFEDPRVRCNVWAGQIRSQEGVGSAVGPQSYLSFIEIMAQKKAKKNKTLSTSKFYFSRHLLAHNSHH